MRRRRQKWIVIRNLNDIPSHFASEVEEADFWDTHTFSDKVLRRLPPVPPEMLPPVRSRSVPEPAKPR